MPSDRFVTTRDGVRLAVRDHGGDGAPLVLMHGAGSHLLSLERLARCLSGLRVVTMDQRWSGQSGDSSVYRWPDLVADVESVITALDLGNPAVAGHSWGGMIAAHYGSAHPDAPGVINLDGHGSGDRSLYDGLSEPEVEKGRSAVESFAFPVGATEGDDAWRREAFALVRQVNIGLGVREGDADDFTERSFVSDRPGRWRLHPSATLTEGLRGDQRMFEVYRSCGCPLLVVLAPAPIEGVPDDLSRFLNAYRRGLARSFDQLACARPSVQVVTLAEANHYSVAGRHAPVVAAAIERFLRQVSYL